MEGGRTLKNQWLSVSWLLISSDDLSERKSSFRLTFIPSSVVSLLKLKSSISRLGCVCVCVHVCVRACVHNRLASQVKWPGDKANQMLYVLSACELVETEQ